MSMCVRVSLHKPKYGSSCYCAHHEGIWKSVVVAPLIINLNTTWRWV